MIYLLYGPDGFRAQAKLAAIREKFLAAHSSFGLTQLTAAELSASKLGELLQSSTLLGGKRLIIIHDLLSGSDASVPAALAGIVRKGLPDDLTVVLYETDEFDRRQALFKLLNRPHSAQHFALLKGPALLRQAQELAVRKEIAIPATLLQQVIAVTGSDLWRLDNELAKLAAYALTQPLSEASIKELVTANLANNVFALVDVIAAHDIPATNRLLSDLLQRGEDPVRILAALAFQLRNLIWIKSLTEYHQSPAEIIQKTSLHPYAVTTSLRQLSKITLAWLEAAYQKLVLVDWQIKTGELAPADAADALFVELAGKAT